MKRLILFELMILFLATTFESDTPPGWFQQTLPVNDFVNDIFFIDTLNGWIVTQGNFAANDTSYIMSTTNSGNSWIVQSKGRENLNVVQFLDASTGYAAGGTNGTVFITFYKTTNSGVNWAVLNNLGGIQINDMYFINKDTGWVCDDNSTFGAGLQKTTNGGLSWFQQLPRTYRPMKLFFINKDTGWAACNFSGIGTGRELYRTTNSGNNWNLQFTSAGAIEAIFFLTDFKGWIRGGTVTGTNGIAYTTNGGFNWTDSQGEIGGFDIKFVNDSIGFTGKQSFRVAKSTDGGKNWGYQNVPIGNSMSVSVLRNDSMNIWGAGSGVIHTTDGGGPIIYTGIGINPNSGVVPSYNLKQNYPNPFNPSTNITFEVTRNSKISLKIFNLLGEEVDELIDFEKHNTGTYTVSYETDDDMPSGVYFYQITAWTEDKKEIFIDSKKMILLK